ncbi:DHHA1 domain-containing protein [Stenotrophomonas rhizophila]|uniref:DHHA1 domain-containing protein n=1 Tax=Stenotrophomonas rhizophila TaxID=216778 RepID=UPI0028B03197|nr:DHHA1 domain-containing protein [Stenotrophomonas rhizophila]
MKPLVIYHANCADGFTAAWAVRQAMDCEFHAAVHGASPPPADGRDLVLVDFCYPQQVMLDLQQVARSILVLDHHKTSEEALKGRAGWVARIDQHTSISWDWRRVQDFSAKDRAYSNIPHAVIYALFDMNRSGAGIAWDFFHPGQARPALIDHVEDRDLWRFALPGTREIQAAVFSYPYEFDVWDLLMETPTETLRAQGVAIERKHHKDVAELVKVARRQMVIGHYDVPVASLPYTLASDAGHLMAKGQPFAACYYDKDGGRVFSLRSTDRGVDVSEVAKLYGGGGHARAAGFTVPRNHELAKA